MGRFEIQRARQDLGFTPATAVRANIDVSQGDVGGAVGQALIAGGRELQRRSVRRKAIEVRNRANLDSLSARKADKVRDLTNAQIATMKTNTPPEKWEEETLKLVTNGNGQITGFDFSPDAMAEQQIISDGDLATLPKLAFAAGSRAISTATIKSETERLTDDFRSGKEGMAKRTVDFIETMRNNGLSSEAIVTLIKAAREAGRTGRAEDAVNGVYAAIEAGGQTGDFGIAKQLATNSIIPEDQQTILRNAIRTAENVVKANVVNAQQALINKTTSDTIREYFGGELTVAALNSRHSKGLIKDSEFKTMMTDLQETTPDHTDPFAAGRIRRAHGDFEAGDITQEQAEERILQDYAKLDAPDKSKVITDLEDIGTRVIGTAKTNAYHEGRGLMSVQFVGVKSTEDLSSLFAASGLTEDEKKRINRRFEAELANRDLYERAVDDRFREMRRDKITDTQKYQSESLRILLQYQRRKRLGLEALESEISREQREIITGEIEATAQIRLGIGEPITSKVRMRSATGRKVIEVFPANIDQAKQRGFTVIGPVKRRNVPVSEMSIEEKQAELQRIRELKQLTK